MRPNGRPPLLASTLPPSSLMLSPAGARPLVACPECGTWRAARRGLLPAHRSDDEVTRCPGSGQRVIIDLTVTQWRARLQVAARETALRRGSCVHRSGRPPLPFRLAG